MKGLFLLLGLIALTHCASAQQIALPQKCEDVFTQDQCDKLRAIAQKFGESATDLNNAIKEAAAKHIGKAKDILSFVQEYLVTHAKNFKCENVLPAESCANLVKIGELLKLKKDQVNTAIREAMVHGATKAKEIYQKAIEYARDVLSRTTCEDWMSADTCAKIKDFAKMAHLRSQDVIKAIREAVIEGAVKVQDIYQHAIDILSNEITCEAVIGAAVCEKLEKAASLLGEKMSDINDAVRAAVKKHISKASGIISFVQEYLVDKAKNFKCENVLNEELCASIMKIGGHFKDGADVINKAIKEAIVHGANGMQEIYRVAVAWLRDNVKAKKCEDLIAADTCQKIRDFANKVHVNTKDVMIAVKEAIAQGAWGAADLYKKAVEFLKSKISCESVMGKSLCDKIRALADKFSISLSKIDEVMRNAIASGVTKVSELYKVVVRYIMDRWTDLIGDEEMLALSDENDMSDITEKLREAILKAVNKVLDDLKVVNERVRAQIKEIILKGKLMISEIKQKIMDLLADIGAISDEEFQLSKRDLRDDLKAALEKAKGVTKKMIEQLLKLSKEKLEQAKDLIKKILEEFGLNQDSFIDVLLDTTTEEILKDLEEETSAFTDMIVADMYEQADQI